MSHYGFVYQWTNKKTCKKYIGSHHGNENDGYIGSGVYFVKAYKKEPKMFVREILEYNTLTDDPYYTYSLEQKYLDKVKDIHLSEEYYNLSPNAFHPGGWNRSIIGVFSHTECSKKKISEAMKGREISWGEKISISKTGKTQENDEGRRITSEKMKGNQNGANRKNTPKGKVWINKGDICKMVPKDELHLYEDWNRGRIYARISRCPTTCA